MYLIKIKAENFRNLSNHIFSFQKNLNCIFGSNGNGKTNLLELIYFLTNKKSFRKKISFSELVSIEGSKREFNLSAALQKDDEQISISGKISEENENWYLDSQAQKKINLIPSVFINPFDSYTFHTSSTFRRSWIDSHFSLICPDYKKNLNKFNKTLKFRNAVLKMGPNSTNKAQLSAIDEQFCEYTQILADLRENLLEQFNEFITPVFKELFAEKNKLNIIRHTTVNSTNKQIIAESLKNLAMTDFYAQTTTQGIHRDDYIFLFDGMNAFNYSSLGQQKMGFISLMFAYIELFRYKFKTYPIVLIDDVSGELDTKRWKNLVDYLSRKNFQALLTTANQNFRDELEKIPGTKSFSIQDGYPIDHGEEIS
jgi:DNA replication and repair protein RecF